MSNAYLKKYAKRIMIQQDKRAVEMEREVEKLLYAKENFSLKQQRQTRSQPEISSMVVGKLKPYEDEKYPLNDLVARKDKELIKTELLYEQLRQEKDYIQGKVRKNLDITRLDIDELEDEFKDSKMVTDYIGVNTRHYIQQKRQLKHTKYRLTEDLECAEEKLDHLKQKLKFVKGKKRSKPFQLEYNTIDEVERARLNKSKEILDLVKQVKARNEAIKNRINHLEVM